MWGELYSNECMWEELYSNNENMWEEFYSNESIPLSVCGRSYISVMSVCGRSSIPVMSIRGRSVCVRSYFLNLVYVGGVNECMSRIVEDWKWEAGEDWEV